MAQIIIRSGIILIMSGVAVAVPDLEPFISLVGAVFFSTLGKNSPRSYYLDLFNQITDLLQDFWFQV